MGGGGAAGQRGNVMRVERGRTIWSVRTDKRLSAGVGSDGTLAVVVATDGTVIALGCASLTGWKRPSSLRGERSAKRTLDAATYCLRVSQEILSIP